MTASLLATLVEARPAVRSTVIADDLALRTLTLLLALGPAFWLVRRILVDRRGWSTRVDGPIDPRRLPPRRQLDAIRDLDPDFSVLLFEDFLTHLHVRAHTARGAPEQRAAVRPYFREFALGDLLAQGEHPVTNLLVGALLVRSCARIHQRWQVVVEFTASHTAQDHEHHTRERWTISRRLGRRSRPPERVRTLGCPNCGAPPRATLGPTCTDCDQPTDRGDFDWIVEHIDLLPAPKPLDDPPPAVHHTLYDPYARVAWKLLLRKDPTFSADQLSRRVSDIFTALHGPADDVRPLATDAVHHARLHRRAVDHAAGRRRVTDRARLTNLEIVRCASDRWHDAITVRIHAACLDYTLALTDDHLVSGSPTDDRTWSAYWTLLRDRAVERDDAACPHCAAPLGLQPNGDCGRCGAHLTTPASDWILARIEPDADYRG